MGQAVHYIILVRTDLDELLAHGCGICPVLGRARQAYLLRHIVLLGLQVVELSLVAEGSPRVSDQPSRSNHLRLLLFFLALVAGLNEQKARHHNDKEA